jgi:hypothetical protein
VGWLIAERESAELTGDTRAPLPDVLRLVQQDASSFRHRLMMRHSARFGHSEAMLITRQTTPDAASRANPKQFTCKSPQPPAMPIAAWIDPRQEPTTLTKRQPCSANSMEPGVAKSLTRFDGPNSLLVLEALNVFHEFAIKFG